MEVVEGYEGVTFEQGQQIISLLQGISDSLPTFTILLSVVVGCVLGIAFIKGLVKY